MARTLTDNQTDREKRLRQALHGVNADERPKADKRSYEEVIGSGSIAAQIKAIKQGLYNQMHGPGSISAQIKAIQQGLKEQIHGPTKSRRH